MFTSYRVIFVLVIKGHFILLHKERSKGGRRKEEREGGREDGGRKEGRREARRKEGKKRGKRLLLSPDP